MFLVIHIDILLPVVDNDRILSKGSILELDIDATYNIVCDSYGPTKWFFKEYRDPTVVILISYNPVLKLREINHMYSGHYYCYGVYPNMRIHFIAKRIVKVYGNCIKNITCTYLYQYSHNYTNTNCKID